MHNQIAETLNKLHPGCEATVTTATVGDSFITIKSPFLYAVAETLKTSADFQMNVLQVITATDYPATSEIELSYIMASFSKNLELILKVRLDRKAPQVRSLVAIWAAANFQEREAYDMMGVLFENHPDFRRILCPDDWEGFPLRKDYVVQSHYQGIEVNPAHKNNTDDQFFGKKLKAELGDPKLVSWSWKDDSETVEKEG